MDGLHSKENKVQLKLVVVILVYDTAIVFQSGDKTNMMFFFLRYLSYLVCGLFGIAIFYEYYVRSKFT